MEKFPTPESNPEKIEKDKVLEALKTNGFEHPETRDMVIKWTEQQENTLGQDNKGRITFEMDRADLYEAAGDREGALECLDHAAIQAQGENDDELLDQVIKKRESLEKRE